MSFYWNKMINLLQITQQLCTPYEMSKQLLHLRYKSKQDVFRLPHIWSIMRSFSVFAVSKNQLTLFNQNNSLRGQRKTGILSPSLPTSLSLSFSPSDCHSPFPSPSSLPFPHLQTLSRSGARELGGCVGAMHALSPPHAPATTWAVGWWWRGQPRGIVHCEWTRQGGGWQRGGGGGGEGSSCSSSRDRSRRGRCGGRDWVRERCMCSLVVERGVGQTGGMEGVWSRGWWGVRMCGCGGRGGGGAVQGWKRG